MEVQTSIKTEAAKILGYFIICFLCLFYFDYAYNEADVIPYSFAIYKPSWLKNDWYLSLKIEYRYLFSYISGWLIDNTGFFKAIVIGRFLSYSLFSYAYHKYTTHFKLSFPQSIFILTLFLLIFKQSIGSGEWIISGFETKAFAYPLAILSITSILNKNLKHCFFFAGLAFSFHLLVGGYNLICLSPMLYLYLKEQKQPILTFLKDSWVFLITGIIGIYATAQYLIPSPSTSTTDGWLIYVTERVPHHTIPHWYPVTFIIFLILSSFNAFLFFNKNSNSKLKQIGAYSIVASLIFIIGILIYFSGNLSLLRFYFFRHAGVMLPFLSLPILISYSSRLSISKKWLTVILISFSSFIIIKKKGENILMIFHAHNVVPYYALDNIGNFDYVMTNWIKKNTSPTESFIIPPSLSRFYLYAERPIFVSFKHSPQKKEDLVEWHNRLKLLNNKKAFKLDGFKLMKELESNYQNLTIETLKEINASYKQDYLLMKVSEANIDLKPIFKTPEYVLFNIKDL